MASVVVNVLRKRTGRSSYLDRDKPAPSSWSSFHTRKAYLRYRSMRIPRDTIEDQAARVIQRTFRGHLLRQELKGLVGENQLTWQSVSEALETIARWHIGWSKFVIQLFVSVFMIVTVYFQVYAFRPDAFEVNASLIDRLHGDNELDSPQVHRPEEFFGHLKTLVGEFYTAQLVDSPFCHDMLDQFCSLNSNVNDSAWEEILSTNCTLVDTLGDSDYVDQANQLLGASFVTQTRKREEPCQIRLQTLDDALDLVQNRIKTCLDDVAETQIFVSDQCPNGTRTTGVGAQSRCAGMLENQEEFTFQPSPRNAFVFGLNVGLGFSMPAEAIQCKIDRLHRLGWLDHRSKQVCLQLGFLNKQGDGRLMLFRDCFTFLNGGRVERERVVASTSLFVDPTVPFVLTWCLIALKLFRNLLDFIVFVRMRKYLRESRNRKIPLVTLRGLISIIPSCLIIAGCVTYLVLIYTTNSVESQSQNVTTSDGFLDVLTSTGWSIQLWTAYTTIISVALLVMLGKTISFMDFHPTSAIISGTLRRSSSALGCFLIIFSLVVLSYAFVGMILLGRSRYEFSSFGRSLNTLLFVAVGEMERVMDLIFNFHVDQEYLVVIQALYFWSYVLLVTILLMNVLLSIIVGAFVDLQEKSEKSMEGKPILSFSRSFLTSLGFWGRALWVYNRRLIRFIKKSCCCFCGGTRCRRCNKCCGHHHQAHPHQQKSENQPQQQVDANLLNENDDVEQAKNHHPPQQQHENNNNNNDEDESFQTPWERLILFPEFRFVTGTDTTKNVREKLRKIFKSEKTIELIILWCRAQSRMGRLQRFGFHLGGLDPDSQAVKGHTFYLLESISKRLGGMGVSGRFERTTVASSSNSSLLKKTTSSNDNNNNKQTTGSAAASQEEQQDENQVFEHDTQMDEMVLEEENNNNFAAEEEGDEETLNNNNDDHSHRPQITTTRATSSSPSNDDLEELVE